MRPRILALTAGLLGALIVVVVVLIVSTVDVDAPEEAPPSYAAEDQHDTGHEGDCSSP